MMTIRVWFLLLMTMTTMIDPVQYGERERPAPWRAAVSSMLRSLTLPVLHYITRCDGPVQYGERERPAPRRAAISSMLRSLTLPVPYDLSAIGV